MELQKFITQSLVEIMSGLKDAQDQLQSSHARICPTFASHSKDKDFVVGVNPQGRAISLVDYDVAVEATTEAGGGGGIKVAGGIIGIKAGAETKDVDKVVSRLKFSVPVIYPDYAK